MVTFRIKIRSGFQILFVILYVGSLPNLEICLVLEMLTGIFGYIFGGILIHINPF